MQRLNRDRLFGSVTPAWQPDGCDRPAFYEQDGRLFDAHDREIIPGQRLPAEPEPEPAKSNGNGHAATHAETPPLSPTELIGRAGDMPWAAFHREAKRVLGADCPTSKKAIIEALGAAMDAYEARQAKRASLHKGMSWDGLTGGKQAAVEAEVEAPKAAPAPTKGTGPVDLPAWGRGQKEYLFGEVQKAIRVAYHRQITERRDAVEFLVDQGVLTAAQARQDV